MIYYINFYCKKCKIDFDINVGLIDFGDDEDMDAIVKFSNTIECPKCHAKYTGENDDFTKYFELTETGQGQLTEIYMNGW